MPFVMVTFRGAGVLMFWFTLGEAMDIYLCFDYFEGVMMLIGRGQECLCSGCFKGSQERLCSSYSKGGHGYIRMFRWRNVVTVPASSVVHLVLRHRGYAVQPSFRHAVVGRACCMCASSCQEAHVALPASRVASRPSPCRATVPAAPRMSLASSILHGQERRVESSGSKAASVVGAGPKSSLWKGWASSRGAKTS